MRVRLLALSKVWYLWLSIIAIMLAVMLNAVISEPVEKTGFLGEPIHPERTADYQDQSHGGSIPEIGISIIQEALLDQGVEPTSAGALATQMVLQLLTPVPKHDCQYVGYSHADSAAYVDQGANGNSYIHQYFASYTHIDRDNHAYANPDACPFGLHLDTNKDSDS